MTTAAVLETLYFVEFICANFIEAKFCLYCVLCVEYKFPKSAIILETITSAVSQ